MAKILIIDDNKEILHTLGQLFQFYEYEVVTAENGKIGLEVANRENPDLIILDALMPIMDGFQTIKNLKSDEKFKDISVIFLSANYTEEEHRVAGLELGADDYLLKPFNTKELLTKVSALLQRKYLIDNLKEANVELLKSQQRLKKEIDGIKAAKIESGQDYIDPDTGIYNQYSFHIRLKEEIDRANRYRHDLSLFLITIDNIHEIEAAASDMIMSYLWMKIVNALLKNTRNADILCRIEERGFAVILPHTDENGAFFEAERIRAVISQNGFIPKILDEIAVKRNKNLRRLNIYMSAAIVQYDCEKKWTAEDFYKIAGDLLTNARDKGGNRTLRYSKTE